jgi:23S rRNA-/tRNA-specific pseudouridylate synthase
MNLSSINQLKKKKKYIFAKKTFTIYQTMENVESNPNTKKNKRQNENSTTGERKKQNKSLISQKELNETQIIEKMGFRIVVPYYFQFHSFAKQRWLNKKLIEVLKTEFTHRSLEYYVKQRNSSFFEGFFHFLLFKKKTKIKNGEVKINNKQVSEDYVFKDSDLFTHLVHRHEPPVSASKIKVLFETPDLIAIDKPASIPIHPTGRYRHNTVTFILARENLHLNSLFPVHRLDRITSGNKNFSFFDLLKKIKQFSIGLLLLARNSQKASELTKKILEKDVKKYYLARVKGNFQP